MSQMTGGHAVVRALRAEGVEVVFGVPGEQVMEIYDGFFDAPDIRLISTRHEQATAYMADGYARTTGKVGVALVTPGPGLYNACAALSTAYATSSPVLLISGQVDSDAIGTERNGLHQIHDQLEIVKPVTKWNHRVTRVEEIPEALHEAMRQLRTGRPRPVELEIPQDLLAVAADLEVLEPGSYPPPAAEAGDVRAAAELLSGAAHPVIWAGGGVNTSGASEGLRELAELLNAPVLTTPEGKGAISDAHPLAIGLTTAPGAVSAAAQVLPQADVVLAVGTRFAVPPTADWALKESQKLVHLDIDPNELGRVHPPTVGLTGDAGAGLRQLLQALRGREHQGAWDPDALADLKASIAEQSRQAMSGPYRDIYRDLREVVGEDGIILSGVTGMAYNASGVMPVHKPRTWITSSYMFTLGYEFSTALGAKVGNPDTPVVAIAGDGGFMYSVGELATAVQYGINLVTIVYNNNAFGASINSQRNRRQGRVVGTELHNPDFAALAETFGATGIRVADVADLPAAVGEALAAARPAVVVVEVPTGQTPVQS